MKIAYFSEAPPDQAALAVFTEGILGGKPEPVDGLDLEAHGVGGVLTGLDGVIRGVHYNFDADGLVVVVDCDDTELHTREHDTPGNTRDDCRMCQLRKIVARARNQLKPKQGRPILRVAIGLAVPSIEAWYLVGKNHQVGEASWIAGCAANKRPFTRPQLKHEVYGTERPSQELETERAVLEARRVIAKLSAIESAFPVGFGMMAEQIRSWKQVVAQS